MAVAHARRLRKDSTDVERILWRRLRNRGLGGFKFRRQHPIGPFVADFACVDRLLVIELDGGQHASPTEAERDRQRTEYLEQAGWRVIRFWNSDVVENLDGVLETILRALTEER